MECARKRRVRRHRMKRIIAVASETPASRVATILTAAPAMAVRMAITDARQATVVRIAVLHRPMIAELIAGQRQRLIADPIAVRRLRTIEVPTAGLPTEADIPRHPTVDARRRPTGEAGVGPRTVAEVVELLMVEAVAEEGRPVDSVAVAVPLADPVVEAEIMAAEAEDRTEDVAKSLPKFHTNAAHLGGISF